MNRKVQEAYDAMVRSGYQREAQRALEVWLAGGRVALERHCVNKDAVVVGKVDQVNKAQGHAQ